MGSIAESFDGSGRTPRKVQVQALDWVEEQTAKNMVLILPTGSGKQAIARALQRRFGGAYLTPNNLLIDQAREQYPEVNYLIGKAHYKCCEEPSMSCVDRREVFNHFCEGCHYVDCLNKAVQGYDTFYNPLSFFYMRLREGWFFPPFIIVDEAQSLVDSLRALVSEKLSKKRYRWPTYESEAQLIKWMGSFIERLKETCQVVANRNRIAHMLQMIDKLTRIYTALKDYSNEFKIYTEPDPEDPTNTVLVIEPIKVPTEFIKSFFGKSRVLLMSATLPDYKIKEIFGDEPYVKLELDSPIPVENRPIVYYPPAYQITWRTAPSLVAKWLTKVFETFAGEPTIVHVTYEQGKQLKEFFPNALYNTNKNKQEILRKFKKQGGIWFASGCAEGVDLPGSVCRVNVIIRLQKANIGDKAVLKSRYLVGGFKDYEMASLIQLQQQVGRSTRNEKDYSVIVIGDRSFKDAYKRNEKDLSQSFKEAIVWDMGLEEVKGRVLNKNREKEREEDEAIQQREDVQ